MKKIANAQGLCDFFYKKINELENKQAPERRLVKVLCMRDYYGRTARTVKPKHLKSATI